MTITMVDGVVEEEVALVAEGTEEVGATEGEEEGGDWYTGLSRLSKEFGRIPLCLWTMY